MQSVQCDKMASHRVLWDEERAHNGAWACADATGWTEIRARSPTVLSEPDALSGQICRISVPRVGERPTRTKVAFVRQCRAAVIVWLALVCMPICVWAAPARVEPRNAPSSGGNVITVVGLSGGDFDEFGKATSDLKVRVGGTAARSTTWISSTSIRAILPSGMCQYRLFTIGKT